ncbi:putative mobilization protein A (plasmid) [Moraxella macacae 0408225]|uniref:Putative mobilization protein A n=1 Tax=Moraxella macacae 0408225 TaxID=1230338 RepID=L2F4L1_9GAMM|nr:relaxase/mobilization nuclease domain-containing protein [Moraxella macacae]ELA07974.1 putative mobilization protein A [Moraxella macacae 0408225]
MIIKFLPNNGKGTCTATMNYLLGKNRDREHATVLRGDPEITRQLADSLEFKHKYTVGVLSFEEKDLDSDIKQQIMADFEKSLLCGLEQDQYNVTWIEHKDKGRLELNFVIPKVELNTGLAMNPYFDPVDRKRVNAFKSHTNAKYNLHDPNDPANRQTLTSNMRLPKAKKKLQEAITGFLMQKIAEGSLTDRESVLRALSSDLGLSVARVTPNFISIKDPTDENGRNIRLKGEIYADTFRFSQEYSAENERASQNYRANRIERISTTGAELTTEIERKRDFNIKRYSKPRKELENANQQGIGLQNDNGERNGFFGSNASDINLSKPIFLQETGYGTDTVSRDTAKHQAITPRSPNISQSYHRQERRWDALDRSETNESKSRQINGRQAFNDVGVSQNVQRFHERLQQLAKRIGTTIERTYRDDSQAERTTDAINRSQLQIDHTERAIEQRERQANEFATKQNNLSKYKNWFFGR